MVAGYLSWSLYFKVYSQSDTVDISNFPREISSWTSEEIPLTATEKAILETDNVFVRKYTHSDSREVVLFIVYSQNNRKVSHPPEICYTGSGATILNNTHDTFAFEKEGSAQSVQANHMRVEFGQKEQDVFYFFKVGDTFTSNYWQQQYLIALKSFLGEPASSALIRISANIDEGKPNQSVEDVKEFARLVIPQLNQYLP